MTAAADITPQGLLKDRLAKKWVVRESLSMR